MDETSLASAGSLPDVATLTRLANEFFRAQPGQAFPASVAPSMPDRPHGCAGVRNPAAGIRHAAAFDARHTDRRENSPSPRMCRDYRSVTPGFPAFMPGEAAAISLPAAAAPLPGAGMPQHDPRSAAAGFLSSPFSLPMPVFGARFRRLKQVCRRSRPFHHYGLRTMQDQR